MRTRKELEDAWVLAKNRVEVLERELAEVKAELRALRGSGLSGYSRYNGQGYQRREADVYPKVEVVSRASRWKRDPDPDRDWEERDLPKP